MDTKELLKKRRILKKKKPEFIRQDAHKKKKVGWKWRKPKGSDSKMRVSRRGYSRIVKKGWSSPLAVRGTERSGLLPVIVDNQSALQKIDPSTQIMVLSSGLGTKKKMALVEEAVKKNIPISNCKDPQKFLDDVKEKFEKKKKDKEKLKVERDKKKEEAKKEAAKKEKKEKKEKEEKKKEEEKAKEEKTPEEIKEEEEKKLEEKKEKDKLLISTQ
jgi:large subunit ribosomal protein L32e